MTHRRGEIRQKITSLLVGKTNCGTRVFENRVTPLWQGPGKLPAIIVYADKEEAEIHAVAPRTYKRTLSVTIEVHDSQNESTDESLDAVSAQIENVLESNADLDGSINDLRYVSTEILVLGEGQKFTGAARMLFLAEYFSDEGTEVPDALTSVHITYDLAHTDDTADATDIISYTE